MGARSRLLASASRRVCVFSLRNVFRVRSASVLGSSNVSTPHRNSAKSPAPNPAAPEDGRTPRNIVLSQREEREKGQYELSAQPQFRNLCWPRKGTRGSKLET